MVHLMLTSIHITIDAGDADVLESTSKTISADANILCTNFPTDTTNGQNLLSLLRTVEFRNYNQTDQAPNDSLVFRISAENYTRCVHYLNDIYTPSWTNTNAQDMDNTNNAIVRAKQDHAGNALADNSFLLTVDQVATAPGNFHTSTHGCFADLHIGYISACLTNAHEGRALINNEHTIFNTFHNTSVNNFGSSFMSALFPTVEADDFYTVTATESAHLLELMQCIYHGETSRFQSSTTNDTEEYQSVPLEANDTISFKVVINSSLQMSTGNLGSMDEPGIQNILSNISLNGQVSSGDTVYAKPVPIDTEEYIYSTETNTISIQLRSQSYELVMTMPSLPTFVPPDLYHITYQRITNIGRDHLEIENPPAPGTNYFAELYHTFGYLRWEYPTESQFADNTAQFSEYTPSTHDILIFKYNDTNDNPNRVAEPLYRIEVWSYQTWDTDDDGAFLQIDFSQPMYSYVTNAYETNDGNSFKRSAQSAGTISYGDAPGADIAGQVYLYHGLVSNTERDVWDAGQPPNAKLFNTEADDTTVQVKMAYSADGTEVQEISRLSGRDIDDLFTNTPP